MRKGLLAAILCAIGAAISFGQGVGAMAHADGPNVNQSAGPPVSGFSYADTFNGSNQRTVHCIARSHGMPVTIQVTSVTSASPGVFTTAANGFQGGELVNVANVSNVSNGQYQVVYISSTTFSLSNPTTGAAVNTMSASTGGTVSTDAPLLNQPEWAIEYFSYTSGNLTRQSWVNGDTSMIYQCSNAANYAHQ